MGMQGMQESGEESSREASARSRLFGVCAGSHPQNLKPCVKCIELGKLQLPKEMRTKQCMINSRH